MIGHFIFNCIQLSTMTTIYFTPSAHLQTQSCNQLCDSLVLTKQQFLIICDISRILPKINKTRVYENVAKLYAPALLKKSLQNIRLSSDNFCLTKSCYWTVLNFSNPLLPSGPRFSKGSQQCICLLLVAVEGGGDRKRHRHINIMTWALQIG